MIYTVKRAWDTGVLKIKRSTNLNYFKLGWFTTNYFKRAVSFLTKCFTLSIIRWHRTLRPPPCLQVNSTRSLPYSFVSLFVTFILYPYRPYISFQYLTQLSMEFQVRFPMFSALLERYKIAEIL